MGKKPGKGEKDGKSKDPYTSIANAAQGGGLLSSMFEGQEPGGHSGKPAGGHDHDDGDDGHELFEQAFATFAFVNMCQDRGYTLTRAVQMAPTMGVDPKLVPEVYKRLLAKRLREGKPIGNASVTPSYMRREAAAAAAKDVVLSPSQAGLLNALTSLEKDLPVGLETLRGYAANGLSLEAYLQRVAPQLRIESDPIKGRKLVAATELAPGAVALRDYSALFGAAGEVASPDGCDFVAVATSGKLDTGGHLEAEAAGLAGGSAGLAALALLMQLNKGPLAPGVAPPAASAASAASSASEDGSASAPASARSLNDHLAAVFQDNQFPGCAFLPRAAPPEGQSAAEAARDSPEARRLTAVFPLVSLLNHDCRPSARFSARWNPDTRCVEARVIAERPLAPGEEVTMAYVDTAAVREERRAKTAAAFGFDCACARCGAEADDSIALKCPGCKTGALAGGQAAPCAGCGYVLPAPKMSALLSLRARLVAEAQREAMVARMSGDGVALLGAVSSLSRLLHDSDVAVFTCLMSVLEAASGPAAAALAARAAAARAAGRTGIEDRSLTDAEVYGLAVRAQAALEASGAHHSPLTVAALHQELGLYFCYAGPDAGADVGSRAAACFTASADGVARLEPGMGEYVALLRSHAEHPPLGSVAAAAARQATIELAARERNFLG